MALSNECHFFCQNLRAREEKGVFKGEIVPLKVCYLIARKGVTVPTELFLNSMRGDVIGGNQGFPIEESREAGRPSRGSQLRR